MTFDSIFYRNNFLKKYSQVQGINDSMSKCHACWRFIGWFTWCYQMVGDSLEHSAACMQNALASYTGCTQLSCNIKVISIIGDTSLRTDAKLNHLLDNQNSCGSLGFVSIWCELRKLLLIVIKNDSIWFPFLPNFFMWLSSAVRIKKFFTFILYRKLAQTLIAFMFF